ncbi:MAG: N-acetylmuramoyl-L-alanine amidase, partial [Clostridia bacterium]|nr:N-acetylmuramoyl-L-alanine amidase [Clostridia bacterium]
CVPLDEKSNASNNRNLDTISIEVCHPDDSGKFTDVTYASLVKLTAWLCDNSRLKAGDVIRHYDITGKECPKYFVTNEAEWKKFLEDVKTELKKY